MIQIDKPMPEGCDVCPLMYDYIQCNALPEGCKDDDDFNKDEFDWTKRPDWCPLKEQEAVEPYQHDAVWLCGNCEKEVVGWDDDIDGKEYRYPFCRQCGRKVKWE